MSTGDESERFAAHIGVRVGPGDAAPCDCGAVGSLGPDPAWADVDGVGDTPGPRATALPSGAVLALVDATARRAAEAALAGPGRRSTLVPMATSVQFREAARGAVTARASAPCEGELADRADDRGVLRFSVAVDVTDASGARVASGTVQWLAHVNDAVGEPAGPAAR